jgi:hypothetical protein
LSFKISAPSNLGSHVFALDQRFGPDDSKNKNVVHHGRNFSTLICSDTHECLNTAKR